jgi:hypothetical protein
MHIMIRGGIRLVPVTRAAARHSVQQRRTLPDAIRTTRSQASSRPLTAGHTDAERRAVAALWFRTLALSAYEQHV